MELIELVDATSARWIPLGVVLTWALTYLATRLLARQPEPLDDPDIELKISYPQLVNRKFTLGCLLASSVFAGALAVTPPASWPIWITFGSIVLVLVACDAVTTWLPIQLTKICWLAMVLAVLLTALLNSQLTAAEPIISSGRLLLGAALGAAACAGLFWLIWRFVGQLGFGDVRLAFLTGAVSGAYGLDLWLAALFFGTLSAAVWGIVTAVQRRHRPSPLGTVFPYGPGLWLGPYLALTLAAIS